MAKEIVDESGRTVIQIYCQPDEKKTIEDEAHLEGRSTSSWSLRELLKLITRKRAGRKA